MKKVKLMGPRRFALLRTMARWSPGLFSYYSEDVFMELAKLRALARKAGLLAVGATLLLGSCIAPQYHVRVGERHIHEAAGSSAALDKGTDTDALLHAFTDKP